MTVPDVTMSDRERERERAVQACLAASAHRCAPASRRALQSVPRCAQCLRGGDTAAQATEQRAGHTLSDLEGSEAGVGSVARLFKAEIARVANATRSDVSWLLSRTFDYAAQEEAASIMLDHARRPRLDLLALGPR